MNLMINQISINIPIAPLIVWYEINFGKTVIPELICLFGFMVYFMWRLLWWTSLLKTKEHIMEKENM
jgi:hypothetical protein